MRLGKGKTITYLEEAANTSFQVSGKVTHQANTDKREKVLNRMEVYTTVM